MRGAPVAASQRDDLVRLRYVERRVRVMAQSWRAEAAELRSGAPGDAGAAELDGCAADIDWVLSSSQADGGPPADHLADAALHLAAYRRVNRAAGTPVSGRLAAAIDLIEAASTPGSTR